MSEQRHADIIVGHVRESVADAYKLASGKSVHASDCATSNAPAMEPGPCDCTSRDWSTCMHEWEEYESMYSNEYVTTVRCPFCGCPGEQDRKTGEVAWPAT